MERTRASNLWRENSGSVCELTERFRPQYKRTEWLNTFKKFLIYWYEIQSSCTAFIRPQNRLVYLLFFDKNYVYLHLLMMKRDVSKWLLPHKYTQPIHLLLHNRKSALNLYLQHQAITLLPKNLMHYTYTLRLCVSSNESCILPVMSKREYWIIRKFSLQLRLTYR